MHASYISFQQEKNYNYSSNSDSSTQASSSNRHGLPNNLQDIDSSKVVDGARSKPRNVETGYDSFFNQIMGAIPTAEKGLESVLSSMATTVVENPELTIERAKLRIRENEHHWFCDDCSFI